MLVDRCLPQILIQDKARNCFVSNLQIALCQGQISAAVALAEVGLRVIGVDHYLVEEDNSTSLIMREATRQLKQ